MPRKFNGGKIPLGRDNYGISQNILQQMRHLRTLVSMYTWRILLTITTLCTHLQMDGQEAFYTSKKGALMFRSEAPLEVIRAHSDQLGAVVNPETQAVAFSVRIGSFMGFNSVVQREHFMENYLEVTKYPVATFTGKIIEHVRFGVTGTSDIRVKGILNIHGVSTERIIPGTMIIAGNTLHVLATFSVPLSEHGISVPKLLSQKIAETVTVHIDILLEKTE